MDVGRIREFAGRISTRSREFAGRISTRSREFAGRISTRSMLIGAAVCMLLALTVTWAVRQSRLTNQALERAAAAEKVAAQARTDAEEARARPQAQGQPPKDPAVRRSRHDDPKEIERVKQLYEEIDALTRIREQVEDDLATSRRPAAKTAAAATTREP